MFSRVWKPDETLALVFEIVLTVYIFKEIKLDLKGEVYYKSPLGGSNHRLEGLILSLRTGIQKS